MSSASSHAPEGGSHAPAAPAIPFADRNHFIMRKVHSLTGIVPVGVFLIEHLLTNSRAFNWFGWFSGGAKAFNEDVHWIHNLPFLPIIEILFIFAPLAFHAGYGVMIALEGRPNSGVYPYMTNRRYTLQRVTAWLTLLFIIVHLGKFRFAHCLGWNAGWPEAHFVGSENPYELTRIGLQQWKPFGIAVPMGLTFGFYVLGLWAAVYHFCNGIWSFCISWGITIGAKAQQRVGYACVGLALVLLTWGHASLAAFAGAKPAGTPSASVAPSDSAADSD